MSHKKERQSIFNLHTSWTGCRDRKFGETFKYRTWSGVCNNLSKGRQYMGAFGLPFSRLLTADYFGMFEISFYWCFCESHLGHSYNTWHFCTLCWHSTFWNMILNSNKVYFKASSWYQTRLFTYKSTAASVLLEKCHVLFECPQSLFSDKII